MKESQEEKAKRYAKAHIDGCENWPHGGIKDVWTDTLGCLSIRYEDGRVFRYKELERGVIWW